MSEALHVVCPHCLAVNRLPAERLGDGAVCGRCKRALFSGEPVAADAASFEKFQTRDELPLLVDFWAPWCGPCRMMAPAFAQAARMLEPHFRLLKIDTEAEPLLGQRYGIRSIPTLMLLQGGQELARQAGAMDTGGIVRWAQDGLRR